MPINLDPIDLGNGRTLKFQRNSKTSQVRAIIVDVHGDTLFKGCVDDETVGGVAHTRLDAIAQMMGPTHADKYSGGTRSTAFTDVDTDEDEEDDDN